MIHPSATTSAAPSRLPGVTTQVFIGLVLGVVLGHVWPSWGVAIRPLADLFLRMVVFAAIAATVGGNAPSILFMERLRMATAVVARWEGQFDDGRVRAFIAERL